MSRTCTKKGRLSRERRLFALLTLTFKTFLTARCSHLRASSDTPLANEHFADERLFQSLGDYLPSGNLLKRSDNSSTARTSSSGRILGPQAAGFDDPVEFRLA